jgi:hypothetical protein
MVVIRRKADGQENVSHLSLRGELWEGFLNAALRSKDRTRLSFASMLCKVAQGGRAISGQYIFRNLSNDEICVLATQFKRDEHNEVA